MPSLLPWRIPAWLAEVIEGRIASHRESVCVPSRTQNGHGVDRARPDAGREDRVGEPVDLDDHEARRVGLLLRPLRQQARDEEAEVGSAAVDAEDRRERPC